MIINISSAVEKGTTELGAFDAALNSTGVADRNLIRLSSVIPPKSKIKLNKGKISDVPGKWGDRLYLVYAEQRTSIHNEEAWAGIGWVQDKQDGKGLFVEHEGSSEKQVRQDIENSLKDLMSTRGIDLGEIHMEVIGGVCKDKPICAMVVAVYESANWNS